jgi:uncharacterized protein
MNGFVIDGFAFSRQGEHREGDAAVADLSRLQKECADRSGTLHWSLTGGTHQMGYPQLTLAVSGVVQLMCQRCLMPFAFEIDSATVLVQAKDDVSADEIEIVIDDESIDVIVGSKTANIVELIEDEALLALPLAPKHQICPDGAALKAARDTTELPFSVLKDLKQ